MAQVPTIERSVLLPGPQPVPQGPGAGPAIARGVAEFGQALQREGMREADENDRSALAEQRLKFVPAINALAREMERDDHPETAGARFQERAQELVTTHMDALPSRRAQQAFQREATALLLSKRERVSVAADGRIRGRKRAALDEGLDSVARDAAAAASEAEATAFLQSGFKSIDAMRADGVLTPEQAETKRAYLRETYAGLALTRAVDAAYDDGGEAAAARVLQNVPGKFGLPTDGQERVTRDAMAHLRDRAFLERMSTADARAREEERRARLQSDLEIAVSRDEAGYEKIEQAFGTGVIDASTRTRLTRMRDDSLKKGLADRARLEGVAAALRGEAALNPHDAADRKAVDAFWNRVTETELADAAPAVRDSVLADFVKRTGIVPGAEKARVSAALASGNAGEKARAADTLDRIGEANPVALDQFSERERQIGGLIAGYINAGTPPDQAVEAAEAAVFEAKDPERKARGEEIRDRKMLTKNERWLRDALDNRTFELTELLEIPLLVGELNAPEVTPRALADFNLTFERHYVATGDMETARKLALKDFDRTWGVTTIGQRRTMKYAPEVVYRDRTGWIKKQFETEVGELGLKPKDVLLISDARTARDATGRPSYALLRKDEDGRLVPVIKDGKAMRFRPDYTLSPEAQKQEEERKRKLERARTSHEASVTITRLQERARPDPNREEILMYQTGLAGGGNAPDR